MSAGLPGPGSGGVVQLTQVVPSVSARRRPGLGVRVFHAVRLWLGSVLSPDEA